MKWALFILLMYYTLCASAQNSTVIRCAYQNSNNFPFQLGSGSQIHKGKPGIAVEMVLMLEQRLDIEIELLRLPWKRAEQRLKEGEVDCLFNASFKKNRLANGQYPMHEGEVDVDKYMRIVEVAEIAENDYNLNISRFIDTSEPELVVDLISVKTNIASLDVKEQEIDKKLAEFLNELGL